MAHPPPIAGELVVVALKAVSLEQAGERLTKNLTVILLYLYRKN